jgi:hypothetical protein
LDDCQLQVIDLAMLSVPTPHVSVSSIYAAIVYVPGGSGQSVLSSVILLSYLVSCVILNMLPLILQSLSRFLPFSEDLRVMTLPQDYLA